MSEAKKEKAIADVYELLSHIQKTLKAPKSQYNKFGKYNYRNCEDILEVVKPLLPDGAHVTVGDEIVQIGERYYIKATASLSYKKNIIEKVAYAREPLNKKGMDESQITGATSSYARKYSLNGLFAIDDTKDADNDNSEEAEKKKIQLIEKHEEAVAKIASIDELKTYYKAHEGDGKEFAKIVTTRKKEIEEYEKAQRTTTE